jgi:hypothetical protein
MNKRPIDPTTLAASLGAIPGRGDGSGGGAQREPVLCGDLDMRIARDGTWFYHGSPIGRKPLVKLFAGVLNRDEDGAYWLTTPVEKGRITVDDAPFVAVALSVTGSGRDQSLRFRTSLDDEVTAGPDHPIRVSTDADTAEPSPYVHVRDRLEALILRPVFYELVELGVEEERSGDRLYGVWSGGCFFPLGSLPEEA